jgi:hypothetical protein
MLVRTNGFARNFRTFTLTLAAAALGLTAVAEAQSLPPNPQPTCTVPTATFNSWFDAGHPALNGSVKPANSITFSTTPNCAFYAWSQQMFMWLTSPAPSLYGGKGRIFNSPVFYDISNFDSSNHRHFIPHVQRPIPFPLGLAKVGTDGLPVVVDRRGQPHEVIDAPRGAGGNSTILVAGKPVEIKSIVAGTGGKAVLTNVAGKPINAPVTLNAAIIPHALIMPQSRVMLQSGGARLKSDSAKVNFVLARLATANVAERFMVSGKPVLVDLKTSAVIDIDPAQAGDGSVLLAQNGSLIFYQTVVNDVFAFYLTGQFHNALPVSNQFPTTQAMAAAVTQYAATHGKVIVDPEALAIESKMAWIEVTPSLPNPASYVTTQAVIPVYNTSSGALWTPVSSKTATLALVGIHVVGSTVGHPEMLWSTFEHFGNTPMATYQYNATTTGLTTVTQNTAGSWLFSASGSTGPFNIAHGAVSGNNIAATTGFTISPSDTLRQAPFGTPFNQTPPNPVDATPAAANTELISIDSNILAMMGSAGASADVRNNYFQTGTTWTKGGAPPSGFFPAGNEVGTNYLTNSTLETYQQSPNNMTGGTNCFSCHTTNTTSVSHMYPVMLPLF